MQSGTVPTSSAWSERLTNIARKVTTSWDYAASFTDRPNFSAHERAGMAMEMWCLILGLNISDAGAQDRAIALARQVVRDGTSSLLEERIGG